MKLPSLTITKHIDKNRNFEQRDHNDTCNYIFHFQLYFREQETLCVYLRNVLKVCV